MQPRACGAIPIVNSSIVGTSARCEEVGLPRGPGQRLNSLFLSKAEERQTERTFTAATWFLFVHFALPAATASPATGSGTLPSQILTTLSLPPLAINSPSFLHSRPHTS